MLKSLKSPCIIAGSSVLSMEELALKYPIEITSSYKGKKGIMRIDGVLYNWDQEFFGLKIKEMLESGVQDVELYINSPGGDVFAANQIINELGQFKGSIKAVGGALVASAASFIAIHCDSFEMGANSQFMYHKPKASISGNEDEVKSRLKLLANITDQYRALYAKKTGKTEEEIEESWSKGDVWLTAQEAVKEGFATSIQKQPLRISKAQAMMIAACGSPIKIETNEEGGVDPERKDAAHKFNKSEKQMENKDAIISKLKLPKDATDQQIEAALDQLNQKAAQAEDLVAEAEKQMDQAIEAMVDNAIMSKKINADQKEQYKTLAKKDFESTKSILEGLQPVEKLSNQLESGGASAADRANWTMQDYLDKDIKALEKMEAEDPKRFIELMEAHYSEV